MGRQCITGTGKKPRDYSRMGFTYKHKLDVLRFLDVIPDTGKAVEKFYPSIDNQDERRKRIKLISDWNHSRVFIESMCSIGKGHFKRARKLGDGAILPDGAEEYLVMWISSLRREGCPVSVQMLQFKALEVAADRGISPELFRASYSWRKGFLRRNKLSIRAKTRQGQTTPEDALEVGAQFREEVLELIQKHNITTVVLIEKLKNLDALSDLGDDGDLED